MSIGVAVKPKDFIAKIEKMSGQNLLACYQCGKCSAGCPMGPYMDILPNQIIRFAQLGMRDELMKSGAIWKCASCMTCNSRCPKGVNIAEIIESVRQLLLFERSDHLEVDDIPKPGQDDLPPIAIISAMRKFSS